MIRAIGLTKKFGTILACDGVSFECNPGEILGLLGPNGAGKTTTLRMLSTALRPSGGTAIVAGYDLVANPEMVRRHIGILPTEPGLYGRLTAAENLRYFGRLYDMPEELISRRIDETLEMLGLLKERDRRTEQFSKGMKQKVAIARAILHDPPAILFDEPTAGLDVMAARAVHDFIFRYKKMGKALILSTHSMDEAERLCDRIAIIAQGRIRAIGTTHELKSMVLSSDLEDAFMKLAEGTGGIS
ncbi:MAG: ATP-binding cassette domain-containing protein [Firmicutes bacterium]|nr:ATP-binding cassette domain-containing protein [Bacillota bacterium]